MGKLSMGIVVAVFMTLLLASEGKSFKKRGIVQVVQTNDIFEWLCQNSQWPAPYNFCPVSTTMPPKASTSTTATVKPSGTTQQSGSTTDDYYDTTDGDYGDTTMGDSTSETAVETEGSASPTSPATSMTPGSTTSSPSVLQTAHWCQFSNGSYVTLGQTFMYTACLLCQCTQSHAIFCNSLQCKPTYCANGSQPVTSAGECCPHCEVQTPVACVYGGISFPAGSIIKSTGSGIECWCQSGTIECRASSTLTTAATANTTAAASFFSTYSDYYGGGTSIYIIIVIICVLLIFGALLCCGGAVVYYYYYYYYQNQQSVQQAYDQYYTSAGWQPMGEDGQVIDENALEKQAEAEKGQNDQEYPTGLSQEYIPPPYAVYNGPYEKN